MLCAKVNKFGPIPSLALVGLFAIGLAAAAAAPPTEREIEVTARKYEFSPNTITVKKGEHVKLVVTALDHDHGFKLEPFKIDKVLKKGSQTTIEFTAEKAGTFPFQCSHYCGMGHGKMKGQLVVEE
jgi:cytochrome c oxidase subunit 2